MMWWILLGGTLAVLFGMYLKARRDMGVCRSTADLTGKTVIITGANKGIGYATAKDLAARNARVIMACRHAHEAHTAAQQIRQQTGNMNVIVKQVDLASQKSVRQFAEEICQEEKKLDILINNAGIGFADGKNRTEEGHDVVMAVNHFGPFLLTNLLLDLLKSSSPSRIVHVSSLAHGLGSLDLENLDFTKFAPLQNSYTTSKLCNVLFSRELSRRLEGSGVTSNSLHPGTCNTDFFLRFPKILSVMFSFIGPLFFKTKEEGAQTSVYCAVDQSLKEVSGKYFSECKLASESKKAQDDVLARALWDATAKITGLTS